MTRWGLAGLGVALALACANPMAEPKPEPEPEPPTPVRELVEKVSVDVGGQRRGGLLHVPEGADGAVPLVVVFHGGQGGEGRRMVPLFEHRFDDGVAFLFPNGTRGAGDDDDDKGKDDDKERTPAWRGVGNGGDGSDLRFVKDLVAKVRRDHDVGEVYAVGFSSGAAMAFNAGCLAPDTFSGIGAVSFTMPRELAQKCRGLDDPMPLVMIAGTEDDKVLWTGRDEMLGVKESLEQLFEVDGCDPKSQVEEVLEDLDVDDGVRVKRHDWTCEHAPVRLYELSGGGHSWPGKREAREGKAGKGPRGRVARDIDGADVILAFLLHDPAD